MEANIVANFLLSLSPHEDHDVTHMKLQKLLYFAQGLSLAISGKPIFEDEMQAWKHGPVVPAVNEEFCIHGSAALPIPKMRPKIDTAEAAFLEDVFSVYNQYSASKLSTMSHREGPWKLKRNYEPILQDELKEFFLTKKAAFIEELELLEDMETVRKFSTSEPDKLIPHEKVWKNLGS